jgi:hypothetical protein
MMTLFFALILNASAGPICDVVDRKTNEVLMTYDGKCQSPLNFGGHARDTNATMHVQNHEKEQAEELQESERKANMVKVRTVLKACIKGTPTAAESRVCMAQLIKDLYRGIENE